MAEWYNLEQIGQPTSQTTLIGRQWAFKFGVPPAVRNTLPPAKGLDVSALTPFANVGCTGITGIGARVGDVTLAIPRGGGDCEMTVAVVEPQGYTAVATGPELKGSRKEYGNKDTETGEMLFVSTTRNGSGIPVRGSTYFTNLDNQVEGGTTGRICVDRYQDKNTIPGVIFTRANFKTAGWLDFRQPNVAKVSLRGLTAQEEMTHELTGQKRRIQGDHQETGYAPSRYIVTKGDVSSLKKKAVIVIETAYATLNPAYLLDFVDTVNSGSLTKLGLAAETCRMLAPDATRFWRVGALWYADYAMLYDPLAGHNKVEVIRQTKMPFKMPLLSELGVAVPNEFRPVYDWANKTCTTAGVAADTVKEDRAPYPLKSWAALDGMISFM